VADGDDGRPGCRPRRVDRERLDARTVAPVAGRHGGPGVNGGQAFVDD
jgi:hypothetical protein